MLQELTPERKINEIMDPKMKTSEASFTKFLRSFFLCKVYVNIYLKKQRSMQ